MKFINKIIQKMPLFCKFQENLDLAFSRIEKLEAENSYLYQRVHNHRWFAIEELGGYLVGAQLPGDYCEFGVYKGDTFGHCLRVCAPALPAMRYFAFDSFQGLPKPNGIDAKDGFTSNFSEGEFACDEKTFLENIKGKYYQDLTNVTTIPGWFNETLNDITAKKIELTHIAAAWVDGDLYASTVPVLNFLTDKLSVGSLIVFDDWHVYRNLADRGTQLACSEWLANNPGLALTPLFSVGHYGEAFTVQSLPVS